MNFENLISREKCNEIGEKHSAFREKHNADFEEIFHYLP